jgi:hypothetical protein
MRNGSNIPFYDKARIMELGIPVTISPRKVSILEFEVDGETIFTKNPVYVSDPGGPAAKGGYEAIFHEFFDKYFTQSYIKSSGIFSHIETPLAYKDNLQSGIMGGRSVGFKTGYEWISKGGIIE